MTIHTQTMCEQKKKNLGLCIAGLKEICFCPANRCHEGEKRNTSPEIILFFIDLNLHLKTQQIASTFSTHVAHYHFMRELVWIL